MKKLPRILISDKTGFRNINGNPVVILDKRGVKFYDTRDTDHIVWEFNLPAGEYYLERGKISEMPEPVQYDLMPMPKPERNKNGDPSLFRIEFTNNPNKCSIDWKARKIYFDEQFRNAPLPAVMFMLYHEHGHKHYVTEAICDRFAANKMLDSGYNPSQVGQSILTLSEKQYPRKEYLIDSLSNVNHYDNEINCADDGEPVSLFSDKLLYAAKDVVMNSKSPSDIFPLVNNQEIKQPGSFLGSVTNAQIVDGQLWLKVSVASPPWFKFSPELITMKGSNGTPLTDKQKSEIFGVFLSSIPGNELAVAATDVVKGTAKTVESASKIVSFAGKNLPVIAAIVAGLALLYGYAIIKK